MRIYLPSTKGRNKHERGDPFNRIQFVNYLTKKTNSNHMPQFKMIKFHAYAYKCKKYNINTDDFHRKMKQENIYYLNALWKSFLYVFLYETRNP